MAHRSDPERIFEAWRASCVIVQLRDAEGMQVPAVFEQPNPVPFCVGSRLTRGDVLDRLERAIGDYYETESGSPRYFGLGGSVAGGLATLTVRPYMTPGERQYRGMMPIELRGEVLSTDDGSEIRGTATAPVGRRFPSFLAVALAAWILVGISGGPFTGVFAVVGGGFITAAWALVIRHNQRTAICRVDEASRVILQPILSDS